MCDGRRVEALGAAVADRGDGCGGGGSRRWVQRPWIEAIGAAAADQGDGCAGGRSRRWVQRPRIEAMGATAVGRGDGCGGSVQWERHHEGVAVGGDLGGASGVCAAVPFLSCERKGMREETELFSAKRV